MLDIDYFKLINHLIGYFSGNAVLKQFACLIKRNALEGFLLFRYVGEEFVLLVPVETQTVSELTKAAEELRQLVAKTEFSLSSSEVPTKSIQVTASIGLTEKKDSSESFSTVIDRADQALYQAKKLGRNRIEVATE